MPESGSPFQVQLRQRIRPFVARVEAYLLVMMADSDLEVSAVVGVHLS